MRSSLLAFAILLAADDSAEAADATYSSSSSGSQTWLNGALWSTSASPGANGSTTNTDVAHFAANPSASTTLSINFNTTGGTLSLGAIDIQAAHTNRLRIAATGQPGVLRLNGGTVNGIANTIISNQGANEFDIINGATQNLTLQLGNATNVIQTSATSSSFITISANISELNAGSNLTFYGGGSGSTKGGILDLSSTNSNNFTGGLTIGKSDGTQAGEVDILTVNSLGTGANGIGNITVNTNSALILSIAGNLGGSSENLVLNGGGALARTQNAALDFETASTWAGTMTINSDSKISVTGGSNFGTLAGLIGGSSQLQKTGGGVLSINAANNAGWSTDVTNGILSVTSGAALGSGSLTIDVSGHNAGLILNNSTQSVGSLLYVGGASTGNITLNGTILQVKQTIDQTFGGSTATISGSGGLQLLSSSTNTLTLSGANGYTGGTTVAGGVLALGASGALAAGSAVTVNGGNFALNAFNQTAGAVTLAGGTISGTSGVLTSTSSYALQSGYVGATLAGSVAASKTTAGLVTFAGGNAYSGGTTISAGTLLVTNSAGSAFGTGDVTVSGGVVATGATASMAGNLVVSSAGQVAVGNGVAAGTFTIGGNLTIGGTTIFNYTLGSGNATGTINNLGTLSIANGATLNLSGITGSGGTYNLITFGSDPGNSSFSSITGVPSGYNYNEFFSGNNLEIQISPSTGAVTWSSSTGGLTDGAGTWADKTASGGANFYTGSSNVQWDNSASPSTNVHFGSGGAGGTVSLGSNIVAGLVEFDAVGSNPYTINGNGFGLTIASGIVANESATIAAPITISTNETWSAVSGKTLDITGSITEAGGSQSLTFSGAGTVQLFGSSSYSGGTTIAGGTVQVNSANSLGAVGGTATISAGTLEVVSNLSTSRNFALNNTASTIYVDAGTAYTIGGTIRDGASAGTLNATGPGTLVLTNASNTYSGGTAISGGTLSVSADGNLGASTAGLSINGGTLAVTGAGFSSGRVVTLGASGGTVDVATGGTLTLTSALGGSGALVKADSGTLDLTSTGNNFSAGVTVNGGTLQIAEANNATVATTFSVGPSAAMQINGTGVLNFGNATSSFNGAFSGSLAITGATRVNFNNAGSAITGQIQLLDNNMVLSNLSGTAGATVSASLNLHPGGSLSDGYVYYIGGTTAGQGLTLMGAISGNASVDFANSTSGGGSGNVFLGAANTWTGTTSFDSSGTISLGTTNALPTGTAVSFNTRVGSSNTVTLDLHGNNQQVASLNSGGGSGTTTITNLVGTLSTLTLSGTSGTTTYTGKIVDGAGAIALYKSGNSTQVLSGLNGYSGGTIIAGGTLVAGNNVQSALGTGGVTVAAGTLASAATGAIIGGNVTVSNGGMVAVGNGSAGIMTISGDLAAYSGSTFSYTLGATSSQINVTNLTFSNGVALNVGNVSAGTYQLAVFSGSEAGSFSAIYGISSAYTYSESVVGHALDLNISALPVTWTATTNGLADGPGTWADKTASGGANFYAGGANLQWDNTLQSAVVFGASSTGSGDTVALGSNITASSILFAPVASPYSITGGAGPYSLFLVGSNGITASNSAGISAGIVMNSSEIWTAAAGQTLTVSGSVGQAATSSSLSFAGPGTLVLSGGNSYSGGTAISGGTVVVGSDTNLGASTSSLTLSGGALQTSAAFSSARSVNLGSPASLINTSGGDLTLSGTITGTGTLEKTGAGNLFITGSGHTIGSATSGLNVDAGSLVLAAPAGTNVSFSATTINIASGAHLDVGSALNFNNTSSSSINGSGDLRFLVTGAAVSQHTNGTLNLNTQVVLNPNDVLPANAFITAIGATGGTTVSANAAITGDGTLMFGSSTAGGGAGTVSLNVANSYTGDTQINMANSGFVILGASNAISTYSNLITNVSSGNGGTVDLHGFNQAVQGLYSATSAGSATITNRLASSLSILTINGSANTASFVGYITENSLSGQIGLVRDGTGTTTLSQQNSYTGGTTVSGGILALGTNNALLSTGMVTVGGGTLDVNAFNQTLAGVVLSAGTISGTSGGLNSTNDFDLRNGYVGAALGGSVGLTKSDAAGTVTLAGANGYSGATSVNAGTLFVSGSLANTSGVTVASGAALAGNGSINTASTYTFNSGIMAMSGATLGNVVVAGTTQWTGTANATSVTIASGASLDVATGGVLTTSSTLDVAGSTLVNNGAVHASVTVESYGVLKGNGSFDTVTVGSNGYVNPGNSPGTMTDSTTNWNGGTYVWEINQLSAAQAGGTFSGTAGANPGWDLWNTGTLAINGSFVLQLHSLTLSNADGVLDGWNPNHSYDWLIATSTNDAFTNAAITNLTIDQTAFVNAGNSLAGGYFHLLGGSGGQDLILEFTAVPEPGTLGLAAMAAGALVVRMRRRRRDDQLEPKASV
ncbi:MAG TPA: autotransporter-associated beta strand repeat-containing protein [Pirellulales bacterium]|nr:autotransporter-associated beta strand repeat-containing protein [Pirellulales bacterium]